MSAQAESEQDGLMDEDEFARRFFESDLSTLPAPEPAVESGGRGRHPAMMVAVMVASALLMWMFWPDASYWFSGRGADGPSDLGDSVVWRTDFQRDPSHVPEGFTDNRWVRVAGLTAFRTEAAQTRQAFLKIAYVPLYVHLKDEEPARPSDHLVHLTVSGRLIDLTRTTRYQGVQRFYAEQFGLPTRRAWMLVAEDKPEAYWWAPLLQGLFVIFIGINGAMLVRALRES